MVGSGPHKYNPDGLPLAERIARSQERKAKNEPPRQPAPLPPGTDAGPTGPARHVIVTTDLGAEVPGLLTHWRRTLGTWEAHVVYVTIVREGRWGTISEWLQADRVRPMPDPK